MLRIPLIILGGLVAGLLIGVGLYFYTPLLHKTESKVVAKPEVFGFLPYALLSRAKTDYSPYVTTLAYFSLQLDSDGSIVKLANAQEEDPGWYHLHNGDASPFLNSAKKHNERLSLVVFSGNNDTIDQIMSDPVAHAHNLTRDVIPVMELHGFSDLNIDIESTKDASGSARQAFTAFIKTVKQDLTAAHIDRLSIDVTTVDFVKQQNLIDPAAIKNSVDKVIIMGYDFHSTASYVSGPIAPIGGAGTESEIDINTSVQKALAIMPAKKVLLGAPLYGYEWETLLPVPRAAVIPNSGYAASNRRAEDLLSTCNNCKLITDPVAQEPHIIYFDKKTDSYHQIFYPDRASMQAKVSLAQQKNIGGIALWALGYEGKNILDPLKDYINN